ncbi:hypothetical protein AAKU55_003549 [Oxalobacteraceae bacterium GrIS 1.11]
MLKFRHILQIAVTAAALLSNVSYAALATTATVYLKSDPGSYIGGAIGAPAVTWTHGVDGIFSGGPNYGDYHRGVSINYNDGNYWTFDFAAPSYNAATNTNGGQLLQVGLYNNAQRFPFNSPTKAGMDVSGNGRGDNTLSGWFRVLEIGYGANGDLSRFAVDFRQFDENSHQSGPSLYGSLRFNSNIAINPVPEPETYAMLLAGLALVAGIARRRKQA